VQHSPQATHATPVTRGPNYENQREMILAGAAELFARRGFQGTTMNEVAEACGLSKSTLYHYYRDKGELLVSIADGHVSRLVELCNSVRGDGSVEPSERLSTLIERFLAEYSQAQNSHRVLTEDVRFLDEVDRNKVLDKERYVVQTFANAIAVVRPDVKRSALEKPLAMLLFGMLNWMFTWLKPEGRLTHLAIAPVVRSLFLDGLHGLDVPGLKKKGRGNTITVASVPRDKKRALGR
jgi:AcrR family transcriptional regulator